MNKKIKVLMAAAECAPFWATGGLADVIGSLPKALKDCSVRIVLPLFEGGLNKNELTKLGVINVPVSWRNQYCGIYTLKKDNIVYYFVENEYYFKRSTLYGHYDDGERFAYFSRAVLEVLRFIDFEPDIIHCHDWHTALVPVYHKLFYGDISAKEVFTIHNVEYQGKYDSAILSDLFGIDERDRHVVDMGGCINLMKGAIVCCDALTTVSENYSKQLLSDEYASGLGPVLRDNAYKLSGILNGLSEEYNPASDKSVFETFDCSDLGGKKRGKAELQKLLNLPVSDAPLLAVVSRLAGHKGIDLIKDALPEIIKEDVQIVVLGKGDRYYEQYFEYMHGISPSKVCAVIAFNKDLAQKVYAASDIFLMPSRSEPCGLSQMIACKYGSVPVVRATGGLKDSIIPYGQMGGNGFLFDDYSCGEFLQSVKKALALYGTKEWSELVISAMNSDFSWERSAKAYTALYKSLK